MTKEAIQCIFEPGMKIIFLDVDGVIATEEGMVDGFWTITPSKQELLQKIIDATDAKIVVSSSWREHTVEKTIEYMQGHDFKFCDRIIGVTIRAYHYIQKGVHLSIPRGVEIKQWLDTHIHSAGGKQYKEKILNKDFTYVILDDDTDMLLEQKDQFVNTHTVYGLSEADVDKSIKILNKS